MLPVSHLSSFEDAKLLQVNEFGGFEPMCILKYDKDFIYFHLTSSTFKWELTNFTAKFNKLQINQKCLEVSMQIKVYDVDKQALLMINTKNIYMDLFAKTYDRNFEVNIEFLKDDKHKCGSLFSFSLPVFAKQA